MNNIFLLRDYITHGYRLEFVDFIYIISILFGIFTTISRNPIVAVLFLIGLFVDIAGVLILVGIDYIGLSSYILVNVGAASTLFLLILMLINMRISELVSETNRDTPWAVITVSLFYFIIGQVTPSNFTDNTIVTSSSNSFSEVYDLQVDNEILNIVDLQQETASASSKSGDTSLVELPHLGGIGNIMYTNYSLWLIISSVILLVGMVGAIVITIKQK
uniref:NADH-ubiquinone oxidoreductase chain 6 n=1 Tax=Aspergillus tubingensis TaxID=5068 RepID=Q3HLK3_ASPTU|nr:NADH dehydrogenase subunit 6 [Aspergillus tubingensis]ABA62003.1 NADH dehydrogenase subunit 6 [Aspergillus tubingensis]